MQNLLNNALNLVSGIVASQKIEILNFDIVNRGGFSFHELRDELSTFAHIQPITPNDLRKYTDSTLDANQTFKVFVSGADAHILSSAENLLQESMMRWRGKYYKIFAKRDWLLQNGWLAFYVTITKDFQLQKEQKDG